VHIDAARELLDDARDWARGRMWIPRALLLTYLVYAEVRLFRDPEHGTIFSGITLAFHEMGHLLFGFAGHFIGALMGSGVQVLVPMDHALAFLIRVIAALIGAASLAFAVWLLREMARPRASA
jgi:hypothetical protein